MSQKSGVGTFKLNACGPNMRQNFLQDHMCQVENVKRGLNL